VPIGQREVKPGRVIYFAGENPDDVRQRWIAMAEHLSFDVNTIDVYFVVGVAVSLKDLEQAFRQEITDLGSASAIFIDTSAAYFLGDDENSNAAMGAYARQLRGFTTMPGGPTVLVNCHTIKNAASDNLLPRGGGAFLAEIDGNLTCSRTDSVVSVHWQGKFRGAEFEPLKFETRPCTAERLKDINGKPIYSVYAAQLSDTEVSRRSNQSREDEDKVLIFLHKAAEPPSLADVAVHLGFSAFSSDCARIG
jgi:AAA domain-containing protein